MIAASLLTLLALGGVAAGVYLGQWRALAPQLAVAGGALLVGLALFWVLPEIAQGVGWAVALGLTFAASSGLALVERFFTHGGHEPKEGVIGPLLAATAVHSFLDGWSVRLLSNQPFANIAVPLGLALHKIPEGFALGLVTRRTTTSTSRALALAGGVELLTLVAAIIEPRVDMPGTARFGPWWAAIVLAVIAGSFLFVGFHTLLGSRRKRVIR